MVPLHGLCCTIITCSDTHLGFGTVSIPLSLLNLPPHRIIFVVIVINIVWGNHSGNKAR